MFPSKLSVGIYNFFATMKSRAERSENHVFETDNIRSAFRMEK